MVTNYFKLNADYKQANNTCKEIGNILKEMNIDEEDIISCEIALREALNNVIKHSYKNNVNNIIEIETEIDNNGATFKIIDYGKTRETLAPATLDFDPLNKEQLPEGGFGLFIIEKLMTETKYFSEENKNTFLMHMLFRDN